MPESFLHLKSQEQSQIYRALGPQLARTPVVLEKDVWVCWVLQTLFTMPDRLPMAFKGGTSLSKVFGAIARFSEDVDITLDYRGLDGSFDPFAEGVSRNRLKKFSEDLKSFVRDHVHGVVVPHFQKMLADEFDADTFQFEVSNDGEQMRVHYPSVLETPGDYVGNSVLIEFGGRNITEPNEAHEVRPDIAEHVAELDFPRSTVSVLSPARTFWEKATLMHVECQRGEFRTGAERLSRHWYDLAMLADQDHGQAAVIDRALLADVVKHKKVFYNTSYANYDACLSGQLSLIPKDAALAALRDDFQRMIGAGMFIGEPPAFDVIVDRLRVLETAING
jgi:predicted nucleotidyltransferase component of viral defense system